MAKFGISGGCLGRKVLEYCFIRRQRWESLATTALVAMAKYLTKQLEEGKVYFAS